MKNMKKRKAKNIMNKIKLGIIGYGNVGSGVIKFINKKRSYIKKKFLSEFDVKAICDLAFQKTKPKELEKIRLTTNYKDILNDPEVEVVVELIGGLHPAKEIITGALDKNKHVVTANKGVIAQYGKELFEKARQKNKNIYFESSVMAGVPIIKTISEGLAGNQFKEIYGIINGTCNYILSVMAKRNHSFSEAVKEAQMKGFAETDPTLDINGMDCAYKLAILVSLCMGKFITAKDIYREGITEISHGDIKYAQELGLTIKLLAIAKKVDNVIEARVHPTLISEEHPLASINGINNAIYMNIDPLGDVLLSGEGAGQMAAASGVISDLINVASKGSESHFQALGNLTQESDSAVLKKIDEISTRFYIRFLASDKPGILSKISGILGDHEIGINSVSQKVHDKAVSVPVIMLTDYAPENMVRDALQKIYKEQIVKSKPVAIRMENLP